MLRFVFSPTGWFDGVRYGENINNMGFHRCGWVLLPRVDFFSCGICLLGGVNAPCLRRRIGKNTQVREDGVGVSIVAVHFSPTGRFDGVRYGENKHCRGFQFSRFGFSSYRSTESVNPEKTNSTGVPVVAVWFFCHRLVLPPLLSGQRAGYNSFSAALPTQGQNTWS